MYIFENHPKKEEEFRWIEQSLRIGDYFDVLLHNKMGPDRDVVEKLRLFGIDLQDQMTIMVPQSRPLMKKLS